MAELKIGPIFQVFKIPVFYEFDNDIPEGEKDSVEPKIEGHRKDNRALTKCT